MRSSVLAALSTASTLAVCVIVSVLMAANTNRNSLFGAALRFRGNADSGLRLALQAGMAPAAATAVSSSDQTSAPPPPPTTVDADAEDEGAIKETVQKCVRMAPWGDICVYHNVCFGQGKLKRVVREGENEEEIARKTGSSVHVAPRSHVALY